MISIFILTLLIFLLILILVKKLNIEKDIFICIVLTLFTVLFFMNIDTSLTALIDGFKLCFYSIIPSIFSFSVICNLLIIFNGIEIYSKLLGPFICKPFRLSVNCSFILIASFLCGYPLGAKYAGDAYSSSLISFDEYKRVLNIASNASPMFILGVLGVSLLGDIRYGYVILASTFISMLLISFFLKPSTEIKSNLMKKNKATPKIGIALQSSIENAIKTTLNVCGYIVMFSLILSLLKNLTIVSNIFTSIEAFFSLPNDSLYGIFLGGVEMTNGCNIIASSTIPLNFKIGIISFFCCFSGLSILFQTNSFFKSSKISFLRYSLLKLIQGLLGFLSGFIISTIVFRDILVSTIKPVQINTTDLLLPSLFLLITPVLFYKIKQLFKCS